MLTKLIRTALQYPTSPEPNQDRPARRWRCSINVSRVAYRVASQTGHNIPVSEIHRRWQASQDNGDMIVALFSNRFCFPTGRGFSRVLGDVFFFSSS